MASYQMLSDHQCRECDAITAHFPLCVACSFSYPPASEEIIPMANGKTRRVKARRNTLEEGSDG